MNIEDFLKIWNWLLSLGLNPIALCGALLLTGPVISRLETIPNTIVSKYIKKFKTEIPIIISFVICLIMFFVNKTTVISLMQQVFVSALVASFVYNSVKRKIEKRFGGEE